MTRIVSTEAGLTALRADWDRLLPASPVVSGFHAPGWVEACWRARPDRPERLHVLVAERDGAVAGILPTMLGPNGALTFIGSGLSNYGGPTLAPERASEVCAEWLATIAADPAIRSVRLAGLRSGDPLLAALRAWRHPTWGPTRLVTTNTSPEVDLAGWDERYREHKSHRRTYERAEKRLGAFGRLTFEETDDPERIRAGLPDLFRFYQHRWAGRWVSGAFAERNRAFQLSAAASGVELLSSLRLDGRVVAQTVSLRAGGISAGYVLGYDDRLGPYSLGTIIIVRLLHAAAERGDPAFDFSLGRSAYKLTFADRERPVYLAAAGRGSGMAVARRRAWTRLRSVGWLRRAKVEAPRLLTGFAAQTRLPANAPGIPAPAGSSAVAAEVVYWPAATEALAGAERLELGFWEMERRFSPRLLALAVERRYRGDRAFVVSAGGSELGVAWLAGPARLAAMVAAAPDVRAPREAWYGLIPVDRHPIGALADALARARILIASVDPLPSARFRPAGRLVPDERRGNAPGGDRD